MSIERKCVSVGPAEYFDVEARAGQIILTPVRIQRGDAVRAKLAELKLAEGDVAAVGKADFLVTGDKGLLVLAEEFGRRIVTAGQLLEILDPG